MTQEEILEYNKRCAEFLGWKKCLTHEFDRYGYCQTIDGYMTSFNNIVANPQILEYNSSIFEHSISDMQFHSDWNWIMKIVEVIKGSIFQWEHIYTMSPEEQKIDYQLFKEDGLANYIEHLTIYAEKETVVQAINLFLIWYNENITKKD